MSSDLRVVVSIVLRISRMIVMSCAPGVPVFWIEKHALYGWSWREVKEL
jgi:hypothetical protein